jgi:hypothetical protein
LHFDGDYRYGYSRISNTYVWDNRRNRLVYITSAGPDYESLVATDSDRHETRVRWEDISFEPPSIRALNTEDNSFFVERLPLRRDWKQGLRASQFRCDELHSDWISRNWKSVDKAIKKEYPSLKEAVFDLEDFAVSRAISEYFFLDENFKLLYKKQLEIGSLLKSGQLALSARFSWLKEQLAATVGEELVSIDYNQTGA